MSLNRVVIVAQLLYVFSATIAHAESLAVKATRITDEGRLKIVLDDGSTFTPAKLKNQVKVDEVLVSKDRSLVGWINGIDEGGSRPLSLSFYKDGKVVTYSPGLAVIDWYFVNKGQWAVAIVAPLHGEVREAALVDTRTGTEVDRWSSEKDPQSRPRWVIKARWDQAQ